MEELDFSAFALMFKEAYKKCFALAFENPMTETESKIFCNKVLDQTGLSVGWKSVKNYSIFITDGSAGRRENPSVATLDTFARYVLGAPYTTEIQRKNDESHYPYWFLFREKFIAGSNSGRSRKKPTRVLWIASAMMTIVLGIIYFIFFAVNPSGQFTDNFRHTDENTLTKNGWFVKSKDIAYWNKRSEKPGALTLYTLKGDNWPNPAFKPGIKNLLLRKVPADCFTAEVHLSNFIPNQEWQQAGILLLEDTSFTGKSIRLSLAFNDFFAGEPRPREILVQAITSLGNGFSKPEEVAHTPVVYPDSAIYNPVTLKNLDNPALRIEKNGKKFRFLYAGGISEIGAFKEMATIEFDMKPRYIGIFAIKGYTNSDNIPVRFKFFRLTSDPCDQ